MRNVPSLILLTRPIVSLIKFVPNTLLQSEHQFTGTVESPNIVGEKENPYSWYVASLHTTTNSTSCVQFFFL